LWISWGIFQFHNIFRPFTFISYLWKKWWISICFHFFCSLLLFIWKTVLFLDCVLISNINRQMNVVVKRFVCFNLHFSYGVTISLFCCYQFSLERRVHNFAFLIQSNKRVIQVLWLVCVLTTIVTWFHCVDCHSLNMKLGDFWLFSLFLNPHNENELKFLNAYKSLGLIMGSVNLSDSTILWMFVYISYLGLSTTVSFRPW